MRDCVCKCGKEFKSYWQQKYCSFSCYRSFRKLGSVKYNQKCIDCGGFVNFRTKRCRPCFGISIRGRKLSDYHKAILSSFPKRTGKDSNFWRDGSSSLTRLIRNLSKNREWRTLIFERDNFTCQSCFKRGGYLEANHKKPFREIFDQFISINKNLSVIQDKDELARLSETHLPFWDTSNGETLCKACHLKTESHGRKRQCA